MGIDILHAGGALGGFVEGDAPHRAVIAQRNALLLFDDGQQRVRWLRLGADHAAEAVAESAILAAEARDPVRIGVVMAERRRGIRIGMVAERLRGLLEKR